MDADWLSFHRYFSDYGAEWVRDDMILSSGPGMLDSITDVLRGYFERRGKPMPPIGLTEYNSVFRQTPACGGSQQFISLLWQAKFIGDAVMRDDFKMMVRQRDTLHAASTNASPVHIRRAVPGVAFDVLTPSPLIPMRAEPLCRTCHPRAMHWHERL